MQHQSECSWEQTTQAGYGHTWTKLMTQYFWKLTLFLGLVNTRLDFFPKWNEQRWDIGNLEQSSISVPINVTIILQSPMCGSLEMLFSQLCGSTPFPLATQVPQNFSSCAFSLVRWVLCVYSPVGTCSSTLPSLLNQSLGRGATCMHAVVPSFFMYA